MKAVKIVVACWLLLMLASWVRDGIGFALTETLPFISRQHHFGPAYEYAAVAIIALGIWGYLRLMRRG
jgi:hypothetical protein